MRNKFDIKEPDVALRELQKVDPALGMVLYYFIMYADVHNLPVNITSISSKEVGRKSRTHEEFRAVDISARLWNDEHCATITKRINEIYKPFGTAPVNRPTRVVVYHDAGSGRHFHLQVRRNIRLTDSSIKGIFKLK